MLSARSGGADANVCFSATPWRWKLGGTRSRTQWLAKNRLKISHLDWVGPRLLT